MKFDFIIVFISLFIIGYVALYDVNYLDYEKPIPYSNWKSITWNDFKALKHPNETLHGDEKFAFINSKICLTFISDSSIEVITRFYPCRSYVFNKKVADQNLLNHELGHLHLTEYCARLLRKDISELPKNADNKETIKELENKYNQEEQEFQAKYDDETFHSYVLFKQKEWESNVSKWIDSLKLYENPYVIIGKTKK